MAMTNNERQARWRANLKAQAAVGRARLVEVFREHMRILLLRDEDLLKGLTDEEQKVWIEAADAIISQKDEELEDVLNALIQAWHRAECVSFSHSQRHGTVQRVDR